MFMNRKTPAPVVIGLWDVALSTFNFNARHFDLAEEWRRGHSITKAPVTLD